MAKIFGKWLRYMAQVFEVRPHYIRNDLNILNIASMRGKRLKYLRNGFTLLKMTEEFDKRQIYVLNDVYMWQIASVF